MTPCASKFYMKLHVNGQHNVTDSQMRTLYRTAVKDDLIRSVFHDNPCFTEEDFVSFVKSAENCFIAIFDNETSEPVAFCWLNGFTGRTALLHFCVFRAYFCQSFDIGEFVCNWLIGSGYVDSLLGFLPYAYRSARKLVKSLGFVTLARIPNAFVIRGKVRDGILTVKTAEVTNG